MDTAESIKRDREDYVNASIDGDDDNVDEDDDASDDAYDTKPYYESTEERLEYESDPPQSSGDESFATRTEELIPTPPLESRTTHKDRVNMIYMRRYLDQLAEIVQKKLYVVEQMRDELRECDGRVEDLENERDDVYTQIERNGAQSNTSAIHRLRAQHERVCEELQAEGELQALIRGRLEKAEYELAQAQVKQGKYLLAEDELQKKEQSYGRERSEIAAQRLQKEKRHSDLAKKEQQSYDNEVIQAKKALQERRRHEKNEAKRSREKANKFYKKTMDRLKTEATLESKRAGVETDKRIDTLLKLKGDITSNRENLRAIQARDRAMAREEDNQEELQRQAIMADGGNPDEVLIIQKRLEKFEKEKEAHLAKQRQNEVEIVNRILIEEKRMKKRKKQQPLLWNDPKRENAKIVPPHPRPKLQIFEEARLSTLQCTEETDAEKMESVCASLATGDKEEPIPVIIGADSSDDDAKFVPAGSLTRNDLPASDSETEGALDLAKPEFEGLWNQHKPYKVPKDVDAGPKVPGASKMEQEILQSVLEKHRAGIVKKQVVVGKEFKGVAFYSKPDVVHFKDFEVGKCYKKKVILTNVSYSVNYLKLIGITEHLKDFIDIHFDPPGQMSAGLTCEMLVTFKPMINEDLVGQVNFMAQTGVFSVPLKCTTKKCDLTVDTNTVEFGTSVIGETLRRHFTLTNNGALGTKFEFYKVSGLKQRTVTTPETSLGGRQTASDIDKPGSPESEDPTSKKAADAKPVDEKQIVKEGGDVQDAEAVEEKGVDEELAPAGEDVTTEGDELPPVDLEQREDGLTSSMLDSVDDIEDLSSLDGMKVGAIASGWIEPFASVRLEIVWQPTIPGKIDTDFVLTFDDMESEDITVSALANAIDVPVWVERQGVDLKICMFDRLYQDTIIVNNRATTALRLKFEVCKELRNHIELLPKTGYIQAQSQFSAQLKFLPLKSLTEEGGRYFDPDTGVLEAPMIITVADQTRPVPFTVHAVVTSSDLEFDKTDIDFGHATIYESVKTTVQLTNHSILPQKFGFVGIPDYVDVQPNDGFGTLLPQEKIELDIIFNPKKARNYSFELTCKSLINRQFKIQCKGVGVHPPLELSHQVVHFNATSLCDFSAESVYIVNSHTSMNEFTHPVPRIGKGEIAPVGPTSFEFVVPENAPLNISPAVGTVEPGQKQRIQVRFSPMLPQGDVQGEAIRIIKKAMEARAEEEHRQVLQREKEKEQEAAKEAKAAAGKKGAAKKTKPTSPKNRPKPLDAEITFKRSEMRDLPEAESIKQDSDDFAAAHGSLLRHFTGDFKTFVVPCYVTSGKCGNPGELDYSLHNTLYLVVHCPAVKPELMVISDSGRTTTNFGEISKGQSIIKSITIQNISGKNLDLKSSVLDTSGPFLMLNSLRPLPPDGTHTILVSFTPTSSKQYYEVLHVNTGTSSLHITFIGRGVTPVVNLSVEGVMDMGATITGEYIERPFKIGNTSTLAVDYCVKLDSTSLLRHIKSQDVPDFIKKQKDKKCYVGTQNLSGKSVFDCVPSEGTIPAGTSKEIMVTFAPDHESDYFSDGLRLELFSQEESHFFQIVGVAKDHIMYMSGGDELTPNVESLAVLPVTEEEEDGKLPPQSLLLTFESVAKDDEFVTATREIYAGCVRTMAVSQKKNGEFFFENTNVINGMGFNVEPQKGMMEAGSKKPLVFTWTPPPGHDPNRLLEASILCTVKGDVTQQYKIMLRALVVSG
ncbi:cilia- and flagella-associated protein 74-like [Lineus longissimus]|uniref:cilia- and flagella-associated protein 74-like n=1 Tax=Lineus longissimus TaxID=88925 RepID=UPI002B4C5D6B